MNELRIFENPLFGKIRVAGTVDKPTFCLADLCSSLEIKNVSDCKSRLNQKGVVLTDTPTNGGVQQMIFVSEGNMYKCIFQSRKPDADKFQDWVTEDVLPSIRKTGSYSVQEPKSAAQMFAMQAQVNLEFENRVAVLENKFANMEKEREENTKKLLMLPLSDNKLPEQSMKSKIRELVNAYANAKGVTQQDTWHRVYKDLYYLHGISINSYKKTSKRETKLSIAERNGFLGKVFDIISNLVKEVN
jgi:toxin-antitoxin system, toxin component, bro family